MRRHHFLITAAAVWATAVTGQPRVTAQGGPSATAHQGVEFATSENCLACHNGMTTRSGEDVSIGVAWRASMMANSARDPYWQAAVRRETLDHTSHADAIQDECAICHMPMARTAAHAAGGKGRVFAIAPGSGGTSGEHQLAADGVSCTLCHQIASDRLGTRESFGGGFVLGRRTADGLPMFGPYDVDTGVRRTMHSATDAVPSKSEHLQQSEVCATCHTLYTEAYGPAGEVIGSLPEQMPYLEWRHSAFAREPGARTCQSCHMPDVESAPIASVLGEPRERLARHTFLGGNFFVLRMLSRFRSALGVVAPAAELDVAASATERQLASDTAEIAITRAAIADGRLDAEIAVRNLTGHKLPTGYPSRRVWVHLTVRDAAGAVVFESGAVDRTGRIAGNDNDADPKKYEPHHDEIRGADQVQVYEAVIADRDGTVTTGLLKATQYVKDNRLLPRGFAKAKADRDIAVHGEALGDGTFSDAGDRVRYAVGVTGAPPYSVEAELRYQPIAFRWADNLREYDAPEPRRFVSYYDAMAALSSTVLATASTTAR